MDIELKINLKDYIKVRDCLKWLNSTSKDNFQDESIRLEIAEAFEIVENFLLTDDKPDGLEPLPASVDSLSIPYLNLNLPARLGTCIARHFDKNPESTIDKIGPVFRFRKPEHILENLKVGDLLTISKHDYLKMKNLGKTTVLKLENKLRELGLELKAK